MCNCDLCVHRPALLAAWHDELKKRTATPSVLAATVSAGPNKGQPVVLTDLSPQLTVDAPRKVANELDRQNKAPTN